MDWQNHSKIPYPPPNNMYYPYMPYGGYPYYPYFPMPNMQGFPNYYKAPGVKPQAMKPSVIPPKLPPAQGLQKKTKTQIIDLLNADKKQNVQLLKDDGQLGLSCQCIKSHCLKQYCYCYKNGIACGDKCGCTSCKNDQDDLNEKRNPIRKKKVACKCTKSQCLKKYCQCYTADKKCGEGCKCIGCKN